MYIFDLDGTLALIDHRRPILDSDDPKRWDKFYEACVDDRPNTAVIRMFHILMKHASSGIYIFSGRSESVRTETVHWLMENVFPHDWTIKNVLAYCKENLFMRPIGDSTPDEELKWKWFSERFMRTNLYHVSQFTVFDDRQKVVDMWRRNGVSCFQVAPGDF